MRSTTPVLVFAVSCVFAAACSVDDGSGSSERLPTTTEAVEADDLDTTTTTTLPASVGIVEVAGETHEIDATCYAPGAGEVLAIGLATVDDGRIEVYLQAFLGAPYLGISVIEPASDTVVYEAAVDRPLDISFDADILRVDDIALVTDLDLETGEGVDAGLGSVVVECRSYETELPSGFLAG